MTKILITGGAGYIGSHVLKLLGENGYDIVVYDNLSTGKKHAVLYGELIAGDLLDICKLEAVIQTYKPDAVIHLAALIDVEESINHPVSYYINNVSGILNLLKVMTDNNIKKMIFSSTAAVYGVPDYISVHEQLPVNPISPYGHSKAMAEKILEDLSHSSDFNFVALRYFNVGGADPMGKIGEEKEEATHLITSCIRAAEGLKTYLNIYGSDYNTPDGTAIRDYIHVEDIALAHLLSLEYLLQGGNSDIFNCGYGKDYSVLEVVSAVKKVTGIDFPVVSMPRRDGDLPVLVSDSSKIKRVMGWTPMHCDLEFIIATAWEWEKIRTKRKI